MTRTERQRYILFEIITEDDSPIEKKEVISKIWNSFVAFFGTYNSFQMGLWLIRYEPTNRIGILRCDNMTKNMLITTLTLIKTMGDKNVIIHTRKTSGTIRTILDEWKKLFPRTEIPRDERKSKSKS